ncbi:hypothetical protein GWI33_003696 [Rhynchophorus ferrugineus]|uniref:Uncharacterized protein n=1 Tax=Rhynchophorus ferrugineus TaxID=354439 RepID=A0A834M0D4_RHYFE|nr:hypothetical protein GWI33_003696 [Rhynchophorus ferrugineus]
MGDQRNLYFLSFPRKLFIHGLFQAILLPFSFVYNAIYYHHKDKPRLCQFPRTVPSTFDVGLSLSLSIIHLSGGYELAGQWDMARTTTTRKVVSEVVILDLVATIVNLPNTCVGERSYITDTRKKKQLLISITRVAKIKKNLREKRAGITSTSSGMKYRRRFGRRQKGPFSFPVGPSSVNSTTSAISPLALYIPPPHQVCTFPVRYVILDWAFVYNRHEKNKMEKLSISAQCTDTGRYLRLYDSFHRYTAPSLQEDCFILKINKKLC